MGSTERRTGRRPAHVPGPAVAMALALALLLAACTVWPVDEAGARGVAADWVAQQAVPGQVMGNVHVSSVRQEGGGWVVEASGEPRGPRDPVGMTYYYELFIDGVNGAVTIRAQG